MFTKVEYLFSDESIRPLEISFQGDAINAIDEFPWREELALFNQANDRCSPAVHFTRYTNAQSDDVEAYASVMKCEDDSWLVVAGSTISDRLLGIFPITKKTDVVIDKITWQDLSDFIKRFYQNSRADLFVWMKKREL